MRTVALILLVALPAAAAEPCKSPGIPVAEGVLRRPDGAEERVEGGAYYSPASHRCVTLEVATLRADNAELERRLRELPAAEPTPAASPVVALVVAGVAFAIGYAVAGARR